MSFLIWLLFGIVTCVTIFYLDRDEKIPFYPLILLIIIILLGPITMVLFLIQKTDDVLIRNPFSKNN